MYYRAIVPLSILPLRRLRREIKLFCLWVQIRAANESRASGLESVLLPPTRRQFTHLWTVVPSLTSFGERPIQQLSFHFLSRILGLLDGYN